MLHRKYSLMLLNELIEYCTKYEEALRFYAEGRHLQDNGINRRDRAGNILVETWFNIEDGKKARKALGEE